MAPPAPLTVPRLATSRRRPPLRSTRLRAAVARSSAVSANAPPEPGARGGDGRGRCIERSGRSRRPAPASVDPRAQQQQQQQYSCSSSQARPRLTRPASASAANRTRAMLASATTTGGAAAGAGHVGTMYGSSTVYHPGNAARLAQQEEWFAQQAQEAGHQRAEIEALRRRTQALQDGSAMASRTSAGPARSQRPGSASMRGRSSELPMPSVHSSVPPPLRPITVRRRGTRRAEKRAEAAAAAAVAGRRWQRNGLSAPTVSHRLAPRRPRPPDLDARPAAAEAAASATAAHLQ